MRRVIQVWSDHRLISDETVQDDLEAAQYLIEVLRTTDHLSGFTIIVENSDYDSWS